MCERFAYIGRLSLLESLYQLDVSNVINHWQDNPNIARGEYALVLTPDSSKKVQLMRFGFTPQWAKQRMDILNARCEGDHNKENDPSNNRAKGIISKRMFRGPIRTQRCLVIANGFILGNFRNASERNYYFVYPHNRKPIFLAGIWDEYHDPVMDETERGFALITTTANALIQNTNHQRSPVIIKPWDRGRWLSNTMHLASITERLKPFYAGAFNAHPISPIVFSNSVKDPALLKPIGPNLNKRRSYIFEKKMTLHGMGSTAARERRKNEDKHGAGKKY